MKKCWLILLLLCFSGYLAAQEVRLAVDGISYIIPGITKEAAVSAEYRMRWIQLSARIPAANKPGRYNSFGLYIYGTKTGTYLVGCCDKANYNEPYDNNISANWFDRNGLMHNISANQGDLENNRGSITVTKINGNEVSGMFNCIISGIKISGIFENVPVSNWPEL